MLSHTPESDNSVRLELTGASSSEDVELSLLASRYSSSHCLNQTTPDDQWVDQESGQSMQNEGQSDNTKNSKSINPRFDGWKFTAFLAFLASVLVLLFNIGFLLFMGMRKAQGKPDTFSEGSCESAHRASVGFHWLINTLSTILLGASNFGMQCLVAPTRADLDRAHGNVFYKTAVPAYNVYAGQGSLGQMNWSDLSLISGGDHGYWSYDDEPPFKEIFDAARNGDLIRLNSAACIETFAKTYYI
ncbi:hypothetical protein PENSTE_c014G02902 [Penicillium steckii]|uniref:DUF6536 domain-containing protein n=1 Tax=Penicillium steckii TaxID=303698 RepID=A0A1V6T0X4_9EURO|nr:hypothetical protein PENSTE_c014G02902 [Penicillium steckii]